MEFIMMKKAMVFLLILLSPVLVRAMTPLSDDELAGICGQSGVSIMPNITMDIHFDVLAWGDSDGLGTSTVKGTQTSGGYVGLTNFTIKNLTIGPRTDAYTGLWPLTIDVGNGVIHASNEIYTRYDLETLLNPLNYSRLKW